MGENKVVQVNEDGFLEELNLDTGEIKQLETTAEKALVASSESNYQIVRDIKGKLVYAPQNATAESLHLIQGKNYVMPYSRLTALQICHWVAEGKTFKWITEQKHMPTYAQLGVWKREHPEFKEWLRIAKSDSAEYYFDKVIEEAEMAVEDKDALALSKFKSDIYRYAAKIQNPEDFSEKKKIEHEGSVTHFVVETGIRRVGDAGFDEKEIVDITKEIEGD